MWFLVFLWLGIASKAELNKDEKPHRLKILLRMGLILFSIGIAAHLLLIWFQSMIHGTITSN